MENNIPTPLQALKDYPWKKGTKDNVNVRVNGEYLEGYWRHFGLEALTKFDTRVQKVEKVGNKWELQSSTLVKEGATRGSKVLETKASFVIL